jgi:uncharacterized glyoxalase superfamily protein PhnB
MAVKKITAVLLADRIEPCVKFWVEQLGFEKTIDVPEGDHLAFASLQKGPIELMYQTYSSVESDDHSHKGFTKGPTFLYVEVENLDETIRAVNGAEVVMPVRTTFYGAKEIGVKDPAGHIVTFAQFSGAA